MSVKTASLGKTSDSGRIEFTWVSTIGRTVKRIGLPGFDPKPDYDKLKAAMDKARKPLEWEFTFDTAKLVFTVQADIGGTAVVLGKADLMAEKDLKKRRDMLQKLHDNTEVVVGKDLEDYDKRFPPPPDPKKLEALKKELERLLFEIKRDEQLKSSLPSHWKSMNDGLREIGFTHWAEPLRLDRFIEFANAVENGQDAKQLATEFIVTKAPRILQVKDEIRTAVDKAMAAGHAPDLKAAHDDVVRIIDATMLPRFRKDTIAAIDKRLTEDRKALAQKQAELKALLGHH
jgi:hypothetical protein